MSASVTQGGHKQSISFVESRDRFVFTSLIHMVK